MKRRVNITGERGKVTARARDAARVPDADVAAPRELRLPVAVTAERRPAVNRWATPSLVPVGVTPGTLPLEDGALLLEGDGATRHHLGHATLVLHRRETEGVLANLQSSAPVLYVVLRPDDGPLGAALHLVTASDHEAQDHTDAGEDMVERVPMPPELRATIEAFVAAHHADEPHHKRKRRGDRPEERKFGQEPLWSLPDEAQPRDAIPGAEPRHERQGGERQGGERRGDERAAGERAGIERARGEG